MLWLFLLAGEWLVFRGGQQLECDRYEQTDEMVILHRGDMAYSVRAHEVDWVSTRALAEYPPPESSPEPPSEEGEEIEKPVFTIDKLDVRRASVIDLIRFLADIRDINLYIDPSVEDRLVTYRFRNLPWSTVMEIVCRDAGALCVWEGNLVSVRGY